MAESQLSIGRSCAAVGLSRAAWYRQPQDRLQRDNEVIAALTKVTDEHRRWGFWKCYQRLRLDGQPWNHKRVYRVYCELGLNHKRRTKKRLPSRVRQPLEVLELSKMAYSLYLERKTDEKRQLLQSLLSNCSSDGVTLYPTYKKP